VIGGLRANLLSRISFVFFRHDQLIKHQRQ
jgi:hypothetical protein